MSNDQFPTWLAALVAFLIAFGSTLAFGQEPANMPEPPRSVVIIGGCSGVCVHPDGIIISAKHCDHGLVETVKFADGRTVECDRLARDARSEGAVVFQARGGGPYPWSPIAKSPVDEGGTVYAWGYPGEADHSYYQGRLLEHGVSTESLEKKPWFIPREMPIHVDKCDVVVTFGVSGGPLFNSNGEVVGICSMSDLEKRSYWVNLHDTKYLYESAINRRTTPEKFQRETVPTDFTLVNVYTSRPCIPCDNAKAAICETQLDQTHYTSSRYPGFLFRIIDVSGSPEPPTPTFECHGSRWSGWYGAEDLKARLSRFRQQPTPAPQPIPEQDGNSSWIPRIPGFGGGDPSTIDRVDRFRVVVAIPKHINIPGGDIVTEISKEAIDTIVDSLEDYINTQVDGAVDVSIVLERTRPTAYEALNRIINIAPAHVFVLGRSDTSTITGRALEVIVQKAINDKLDKYIPDGTPVTVAMESTDYWQYKQIEAAADCPENPLAGLDLSTWEGWAGVALFILGGERVLRIARVVYLVIKTGRKGYLFAYEWTQEPAETKGVENGLPEPDKPAAAKKRTTKS